MRNKQRITIIIPQTHKVHKTFFVCFAALWEILITVTCLAQNPSFGGLKELLKQHPHKDSILMELAKSNKLIGTYWQTIQPSEAINYFRQSLEEFKETGNKEEVVHVHQMIATTYYYLDDYDKQLFHLKKALQDALKFNNAELEINLLYQISKVYCYLNNYETAMEYSLLALQESYNNNQWMLDEIMTGQSEIELKKGNYQIPLNLNTYFLARVPAKGQQSPEQMQKTLNMVLQVEVEQLNMILTCLRSINHEQNNQTAQTNTILIVLSFVACGGFFFLTFLKHSFKNLKLEKIRFTDEQTTIIEKHSSLSNKYQSLLQKKESHQELNNNLTNLNRSKTELFKAISHDLQTPLIRLQQNLTNLMTDISEEQFRQATAGLTTMVGDISLLLENLLQWSKFQSQGIHAKPQYTELIALVNDTVDLQKYSAAEKKITLSNALEQKIFVYADENMVKILLKTILQNIIKLSESGATISISGNKDKQNGWLQALYKGQMPLKPTFLQQSQTVNYGSETTELGKAIILGWMLCRTIVKTNNGNIRVEDLSAESFQVVLYFPLEEVQV